MVNMTTTNKTSDWINLKDNNYKDVYFYGTGSGPTQASKVTGSYQAFTDLKQFTVKKDNHF